MVGSIILIWILSICLSIAMIVCYFVMCSKVIKISEKLDKIIEQNSEQNTNIEALLKLGIMIKNQK